MTLLIITSGQTPPAHTEALPAAAPPPSKTGAKPATKRAGTPAREAVVPEKALQQEHKHAAKFQSEEKSNGTAKKLSAKAAEKSATVGKKALKPKEKLVRDSFTMPQDDYALIASLKDRALKFKRPAKKSELLRAGLHALQALPAPALRAALDSLTPLKAGRPKRAAV